MTSQSPDSVLHDRHRAQLQACGQDLLSFLPGFSHSPPTVGLSKVFAWRTQLPTRSDTNPGVTKGVIQQAVATTTLHEQFNRLDPSDAADVALDAEPDRLGNVEEFQLGTEMNDS